MRPEIPVTFLFLLYLLLFLSYTEEKVNAAGAAECEVAMDLFEKIGDTITTKGKEAADKAKEIAEIANLRSQIATCEEVIRKNYLEIGKVYYELYGDMTEEAFEKQCNAIRNARHGIEELQQEINDIKGI